MIFIWDGLCDLMLRGEELSKGEPMLALLMSDLVVSPRELSHINEWKKDDEKFGLPQLQQTQLASVLLRPLKTAGPIPKQLVWNHWLHLSHAMASCPHWQALWHSPHGYLGGRRGPGLIST